jgi:hypothetical protein
MAKRYEDVKWVLFVCTIGCQLNLPLTPFLYMYISLYSQDVEANDEEANQPMLPDADR